MDTENITDLHQRKDQLKTELIEVEKAICRHPVTIRGMFSHNPLWSLDRFEELVSRITFAKELTPREDVFEVYWYPFLYQVDGRNYTVEFSEEGGYSESIGAAMEDEVWNADDPIAWLEGCGITEPHKQIGYLMYLTKTRKWYNRDNGQ